MNTINLVLRITKWRIRDLRTKFPFLILNNEEYMKFIIYFYNSSIVRNFCIILAYKIKLFLFFVWWYKLEPEWNFQQYKGNINIWALWWLNRKKRASSTINWLNKLQKIRIFDLISNFILLSLNDEIYFKQKYLVFTTCFYMVSIVKHFCKFHVS